jgi:single-stranded DNA-binding protein
MSNPFNFQMVIGNLGKKPELQKFKNGTPYCFFEIASNRQGEEAGCDWIRCRVTNGAAEAMVKYGDKGRRVMVTGEHRQGFQSEKAFSFLKGDSFRFLDANPNKGEAETFSDPDADEIP